jgi:hypothetical protein
MFHMKRPLHFQPLVAIFIHSWRGGAHKRHRSGDLIVLIGRLFFSVALPAHSGHRPHIQSRKPFSQTVGLLGRVISPSQSRYINTGQHKHRINAHRHPCLQWDLKPQSQRPSERRQFMPQTARPLWSASVRASEDSSCLTPRGHCDRLASVRAKTVHASERAATVIG